MLPRFISRLSGKLLILTILFVLLAEAVIFFPSAASFRQDWLRERAESAGHITLALNGVPDTYNRMMLSETFMKDTDISVVTTEIEGESQLVLGTPPDTTEFQIIDLRGDTPYRFDLKNTLAAFSQKTGYFRVLANPPADSFDTLEYLVPRAALQKAMERYCHNILQLSILIALITGLLIYSVLSYVIIRPIRRLSDEIAEFREDPAAPLKANRTGGRKDEIGDLSRSFTDMQEGVQSSFEQRRRLADLGLAVSKINHDLRNVLTSAQLVSDRLAMDKDERVAKMGERLVRAVDRGVRIAEGVLDYSQDKDEVLNLEKCNLAMVASEAAIDTLKPYPQIAFENQVDKTLFVMADADHTYRIFQNIVRNAAQALAKQDDAKITILSFDREENIIACVKDNGPGLAKKARENLFTPFKGSTGVGRTGLGLTISKELAQAQGGDLELVRSDETGTVFEVSLKPVA